MSMNVDKRSARYAQIERLMAISRHTNYIKDRQKYEELALCKEKDILNSVLARKLESLSESNRQNNVPCNVCEDFLFVAVQKQYELNKPYTLNLTNRMREKWGLTALPSPFSRYDDLMQLNGVMQEDTAVEIVDEIDPQRPPIRVLDNKKGAMLPKKRMDELTEDDWWDHIKRSVVIDGTHLYLRIDICALREEIDNSLKMIIDAFRQASNIDFKKMSRNREGYNHWDVYDAMHKNPDRKPRLIDIAREWSNAKPEDTSANSSELKSVETSVRKAYKKAVDLIKGVGLEIKMRN